MKKPSKVVFINDRLEKSFNSLKEDDPIRKAIVKAVRELKQNAFCGIQIPKRLIPKSYVKYGLKNMWKYDLPQGWRLLYTVSADEVGLISAILEWLNHKDYEKRMNY